MTATKTDRTYEVLLWGATGYTGKVTAEYISKNLPLDLNWAIAGRDRKKLETVNEHLKTMNPTRPLPAIEVFSLKEENLDVLTKKTLLVISTVGPFQLYGNELFRLCAQNGTHYVDSTGGSPFVGDMIKAHDELARKNGSIIIPCCGFDCVPSDISTWVAVSHNRRTFDAPTARVDVSIHSLKGSVSGGTLSSFINAFDRYSFSQLYAIHAPYSFSPKKPNPTEPIKPSSLWTKLFGLLYIRNLGWLGYQPQGPIDRAIVHRTWGLLDGTSDRYGDNFDWHAWARLWGPIAAVFWHFTLWSLTALFLLRPVRWLLSKVWYKPGNGASVDKTQKNWLEYRTVGDVDDGPAQKPVNKRRSVVRLRFDSDPYIFTGVTLAEAAKIIVRRNDTQAHKLRGGVLTPATLGDSYVAALTEGGVTIDVKSAEGKETVKW